MTIGVLQLELHIEGAMSLKDKRRAIRSVRDRIANAFNVSVAETGAHDQHRRCIYTAVMVGTDKPYVEGALDKIVDLVRTLPQVDLGDYRIEFV